MRFIFELLVELFLGYLIDYIAHTDISRELRIFTLLANVDISLLTLNYIGLEYYILSPIVERYSGGAIRRGPDDIGTHYNVSVFGVLLPRREIYLGIILV